MQVSGTHVTRHCDQASRVAKAMLKQFSRGRSILSLIFLQGVKKKKNKKRIRENYTNYSIKRNHSCIKLFRLGGRGEKIWQSACLPVWNVILCYLSLEDKGIFYRCLCVVFENRSPYETGSTSNHVLLKHRGSDGDYTLAQVTWAAL